MNSSSLAFHTFLPIGHQSSRILCRRPFLSPVRRLKVWTHSRQRKTTTCLQNTNVAAKAFNQSLEWISQNGGKADDSLIDVSRVDSITKRGLYVSSDSNKTLLKNTEMLSIPESLVLTPKKGKVIIDEWCAGATDKLKLSDESCLALALLIERKQGPKSSYAQLIQSLPQIGELDLPIFWSEKELEILKGSSVYENSIEIRRAIEDEFKSLKESLEKINDDGFSLELYKWAIGIVDSRCIYASSAEPLVLAPLFHCINAGNESSKANAHIEISGGIMFSKKRFTLILDSDMKGDEELKISYGENMKAGDYVLERGMSVKDGMKTMIEMVFDITKLDKYYEDKYDILEMVNIEPSTSFELEESEDERKWEGPKNLDGFLRLCCLTGMDCFLLESVFRGEVWEFMQYPVSEENERGMCELVIDSCDDRLDEYSWNDDEEMKKTEDERYELRKEIGRSLIRKEKELLESVKMKYQKILGSLDALEYYAERRLKALDLLRPIAECEIRIDSESGSRIGRAFDENYS